MPGAAPGFSRRGATPERSRSAGRSPICFTPPGITVSQQFRTPDGQLYILALDIKLQDISHYTSQLDVSPRGFALLFDDQMHLLARSQKLLAASKRSGWPIPKLFDSVLTSGHPAVMKSTQS